MRSLAIPLVLCSLCAIESSLANPSAIYLSCDVVYRPAFKAPPPGINVTFQTEPSNERTDITISGSGETLSIETSTSIVGLSFHADRKYPFTNSKLLDNSTDAKFEFVRRDYADRIGEGGFRETRLEINRYTGFIRIESKLSNGYIQASSEGRCVRHGERKF